jgi:diguanylate cyclase (GGDEF)-like protein
VNISHTGHGFINHFISALALLGLFISAAALAIPASPKLSTPVVIPYCIDPNWLPYEAIINGKHVGISADYLQLVAHETGYKFELIVTDNWPQSLAYLQQGKCGMTPFLNKTSDREQFLLFSDIYFEAPNVLVSLKSQPFLQGFENIGERSLAIPAGYQLVEYVQRHYPQIKLVLADNEKDGLERVARGDVDVFVGSMLSVNTYIKQRGLTDLKIAGWGGPADELRYGIIQELHHIIPRLNYALRGINEQQRLAIYNKWNNVSVVEDIDYQIAIQILGILAVIIFVLIYRNYNIKVYSQALEVKNNQLEELRCNLERKNQQLDFLSAHDPLTKLYNRHYFNSQYIDNKQDKNNVEPMCLIIMDVDYFKLINDNFGHNTGDIVLAKLAELLSNTVRAADVVTRWGGEEFIILCPELTLNSGCELCQRLAIQIQQTQFVDGVNISCSFGVAQRDANESILVCLDRADKALYRAKEAGRNQICSQTS